MRVSFVKGSRFRVWGVGFRVCERVLRLRRMGFPRAHAHVVLSLRVCVCSIDMTTPVQVEMRGAVPRTTRVWQLDHMFTVLPAAPHGVANEQVGGEGNSRRRLPVEQKASL